MSKIPTMSVVLLTCNRLKVTRETLEYLLATTHVDFELVIVHNNNQTPEAQKVKEYFKNLKIKTDNQHLKEVVKVFNKTNRGVAGGRNDGIYHSSGKHKVVIDDDILVPDCWAETALKIIKRIPRIATVGVSVETNKFPVKTENGVSFQLKDGNIGGALIVVPARTFKRVGYFCEDYGIYGMEDADYYMRIKALGMYNAYIHPMKARHIDPENDKKYRAFKNKVYQKGSVPMRMFKKNNQKYKSGKGLFLPYRPII